MAAAKQKPTPTSAEIQIRPVMRSDVTLRIIGTTPLIQNRMSAKVKQGLLVGTAKKTKAERAGIKHDPLVEYRASADTVPAGPTALGLQCIAIKAAMCEAAIETAGLAKTQAQRLLLVPGDHAALYGTPRLRMDVVRSADINRTPDVRSRACLPQWGAELTLHFVYPQLSAQSVINLLANAGMLIGVGDGRQAKGKLNCGLFRVIGANQQDDEWDELVKNHGRKAQVKALENPEYYNDETRELMDFFYEEVQRRAA